MMHYVMDCDGVAPMTTIEDAPRLPGGPWMKGRKLRIEVPEPLRYQLDADYPGNLKAMYKAGIPVLRMDLVQALLSAGVENLELFDAVIEDPATGQEHTDYKAFNVVGLVACADTQASEMMGTTDSTMIDSDFHSLVIDESLAQGLLLFRLAESVNAIVVHEKVKKAVEQQGIPGMVFYGPGEWSG